MFFKGFLEGDELIKEYVNSSLFILPTREDCFDLVTLEAMCCGLSVISSKYADSAYDLIEEGRNGYIVDPYDKKSLSDAIEKFLADGKLIENMGQTGKIMTGKFNFSQTSKGFIEAIKAIEKVS